MILTDSKHKQQKYMVHGYSVPGCHVEEWDSIVPLVWLGLQA